ncbi:MAG: class I SAM-dependent methyltransferase [Sphaerochaeta sp.]|nr:class I SAM-dependent methyltransferase [Sphaerochaeta sp.]
MNDEMRVCPAQHAGMLDNGLRRLIHPGDKFLSPFINKGDLILDLGCGPGSFTNILAQLTGETGRVIAVDLQKKMLETMETKMRMLGLFERVESHLCCNNSLMLQNYEGEADFALAFWMIHEAPDVGNLLSEVYEALRFSGTLLCSEPVFHVSKELFKEMIGIGEEIGFSSREVEGIRFSRSILFTKN